MAAKAAELLLVGRVSRAHGLRGECKVIPECDDPERLLNLDRVWVGSAPTSVQAAAVDSARLQRTKRGPTALLRLNGAGNAEEAMRFAKLNVYARERDLPPLAPGEFFLHDLVGMTVTTTDGIVLGAVKDVWEMPSSNIYVVARRGQSDALIPAVPNFVRAVNLEQRTMVIAPIEGLLG